MENYDVYLMQDAQASTGNGNVFTPARMSGEFAFYVSWSAGVTAGAVTIETADDKDYQGTWAELGTVTAPPASRQDVLHFSGVLIAVRARISTAVTGGTVTVKCLSGRN